MHTSSDPGPKRDAADRRLPVHPLVRAFLSLFAAPRINMREDYEKVRKFQRQIAAPLGRAAQAVDHEVPSEYGSHQISVRVFHPKVVSRADVLVFFHGGGWVIGGIDSYTPTSQRMADMTGAVVVAVGYRLAPEHPFPAGLQDCYQLAHRLLEDPRPAGVDDPKNIVLIGDSAGGNLAAVVSLLLREKGFRVPTRQILLYPVTHWDHDARTSPFDSVREHGADLRLTNAEVQAYLEMYVPAPTQRKQWQVSPLLAEDKSHQPDTLVVSAELDLLRDEGEAYGRMLAQAGNTVRIHRVQGALHGFIALPRISRAVREAYEVINEFLDAPQTTQSDAKEAP